MRGFQVVRVAWLVAVVSCGGGGTDPAPRSTEVPGGPPTNLTYSANPAKYIVGTDIPLNTPVYAGGTVALFSITPDLPQGLAFNPISGIVSGKPAFVMSAREYTVTGSNAAGQCSASLVISVVDLPPSNLSYPTTSATYVVGTAIPTNTPTATGTSLRYSASPSLPPGVSLDPHTGAISGTPSAPAAGVTYTISASNSAGRVTATLTIQVNDAPPTGLAYTANPAVYVGGVPIPANGPTYSGGRIVSYSVSPPLPSGLSLSSTTGVITGTPTAVASGSHTVTGRNSGGSTSVTVTIQVNAPPPPTITMQPSDVVVSPNHPVSLTVTATGGGLLSYEWRRDGVPIPGAISSTYAFAHAAASDNRRVFTAIVSDTFGGRVTSDAATVIVQGFVYTGSLAVGRANHTATLLKSGNVLVAGGGTATAELYDPNTGTWSPTGSMNVSRRWHAAALTGSGKVLVVGGDSGGTAEVYDPANGTWTMTGPLSRRRGMTTATSLPSGRVLVVGGDDDSASTSTSEIYDPDTNSWSAAAQLPVPGSELTATSLASGDVLVTGGFWNTGAIAIAQQYELDMDAWVGAGSTATARGRHTATTLNDGRVLVAAGLAWTTTTTSAELYDPSTITWSATGSLAVARQWHTATLLTSGKVLVVGGTGTSSERFSSAEIYDPNTGTWAATGSLSEGRYVATATLLPSGKVLVVGGYTSAGQSRTAEIWSVAPDP